MGFNTHMIGNIQGLIRVYYSLHKNGLNQLKSFGIGLIILNLNTDDVYDITTSNLKLTLLIISGQILADL